MAEHTHMNSQITDAVTQANVKVLADAPAMAMANLYQATAQALSNAAHNATASQQLANITAQAATAQSVNMLLSITTSEEAVAVGEINRSDLSEALASLKAVAEAMTRQRPRG